MNPLYPEIVPIRLSAGKFLLLLRIHTSSSSAIESQTTTTMRSGSIKLFTKIPHHTPSHGTRYFSYLNRSLVISRSEYFFPKESLHGRMRMKNWNFPDDSSQLCSSWLHFSEVRGIGFQDSRKAYILRYMYVLRHKQCNITESKMQNFFTQSRKGVLRARVSQFSYHGMWREVRSRRSPGWERIKRE